MASMILSGDTSGTVTLSAPLVAGSNTATLPAQTGTLQMLGQGTAVATTSGTSVDFTGIPSWVKRITVMFRGVSGNGTSPFIVQLGTSSGVQNTGYLGTGSLIGATVATTSSTAGFYIYPNLAADVYSGNMIIINITGNAWVSSYNMKSSIATTVLGGGDVSLSSTLDRIRITTVNGTDTFDAGSVNILYEG
jgi:hypothetical protein